MLVLSSHDATVIRTALLLYPGALPAASNASPFKWPAPTSTRQEAQLLIEDLRRLSEDPVGISDGTEYAELTYEIAVGHQTYIEQEALAMTRPCRAALQSPESNSLGDWILSLLREGTRRLEIVENMTVEQRRRAMEYDPSSMMDTVEF